MLAERDAQLQAAVVRAAAAEEELVAERGGAAGLRAQLRALQADSEQQLAGLKVERAGARVWWLTVWGLRRLVWH